MRTYCFGTPHEQRRWTLLLRATDRVAPYIRHRFDDHLRWRDTLSVIRAYVSGHVMIVPRPVRERLARGLYGWHEPERRMTA